MNPIDWDVRSYETIDSTNLEARRLLEGGASAGLVVTARHQTGGMGRMGRGWLDQPGKSLIVSLVLEGAGGFESSMLVALSARAAVAAAGGRGPRFKWPNDLVYGAKKVGGILSEVYRAKGTASAASTGSGRGRIIVGLGLNVGYLPGELDIPAKLPPTSLVIEEGKIWDPDELLHGLLRELQARWEGSREEWLSEYRGNLACIGESIRVSPPFAVLDGAADPREDIVGVMEGIDDAGNLVLRVGERTLRLASGDIHPQ